MDRRLCTALLGLAFFTAGAFANEPPLGQCLADGQIPADTRNAIERVAVGFSQKIADHDVAGAIGAMTDTARAYAIENKSDQKVANLIEQIGKLRDVKLEHMFFVRTGGIGQALTVKCSEQYSVTARSHHSEAYATLSMQSDDYGWAVSIWLEPAPQGFTIRNFNITMSDANGKSPAAFVEMARAERKAGHLFNAHMLYYAATANMARGEIFHLRLSDEVNRELVTFEDAEELRGEMPVTWNLDGKDYTIGDVTVFADKGKLGLRIELPDQNWTSNEVADAKCRAFLDAFRAAHPEWRPTFGKVEVRLIAPDKKTDFGRTYTDGAGYDSDVQNGKA